MIPPARSTGRVRLIVGCVIALAATLLGWSVATAHTDFESSTPADGDVVDAPLREVVVNFTNPARSFGDGFELLDPAGAIRAPVTVDETDGTTFVLTFEPPLDAGEYGLRWNVQAGDAHPIDGSFSFEIVGTPASVASPSEVATAPSIATPTLDDGSAAGTSTTATESADESAALDEFLHAGTDHGGSTTTARIGRTLSITGLIFGVGVLAALVWTVRGRRHELDALLVWIRLAGLVVFAGGLIEFAALVESDPTTEIGGILTTKAGIATLLKMVGGLVALFGFHRGAGSITTQPRSLSSAIATDPHGATTGVADQESAQQRWSPSATAAVGIVGYGLVLASFWFDGHTVSEGPWVVHSAANLVHLVAAAVWGGGVFAMTAIAWTRRRRAERAELAAMVVRFSSVATVSLVLVIVAGLVLSVLIVDGPGDIVSTTWGRILIAKTSAVAVAAGLGGYNHFKLRPELEARPDDPALARELRSTLLIESAMFVIIAVLTAVLVAAAT